MAYSTEAHEGPTTYMAVIVQDSTGVKANVMVTFDPTQVTTENQRDILFQAFLTRVSGLSGVTVQSAAKKGGYSASVTP